MILKRIDKDDGVSLFSIQDERSGFYVQLSNLGATIVHVKSPDKDGNIDDVNLGHDDPKLYKTEKGYFGASVGRVANRIKNGIFILEGKKYSLAQNNADKHCLHGGINGFSFRLWECLEAKIEKNVARIKFQYVSKDGEENFPGNLTTTCEYIIKPDPMELSWVFTATTDKTTIINLTNHSYWNLDGLKNKTTIHNHELILKADRYMPGDSDGMVFGNVESLDGLGIDFRNAKMIGDAMSEFGDLDNNIFLSEYDETKKEDYTLYVAAELKSIQTGRKMVVKTSEPCVQIYSSNYTEGVECFGEKCVKHCALCLEAQRPPNAINIEEYKDYVILKPVEQFYHKTSHTFSIE